LAALVLLVSICAAAIPGFARIEIRDGRLFGALIDIMHRGTPVILLAIGMTLVIATRGIDLSVGAVMAIVGAVAALCVSGTHIPVYSIVLIALGVSIVAGLWNGVLVALFRIQPIVATLILMVAGRGLAQLLTGGQIVTIENHTFESIAVGSIFMLPTTIYIAALVLLAAFFIARRTVVGPYIEAVGANETASEYSGINVRLVKLFVYAFSGFCCGIAGLIATADIKAADPTHCGMYLELDAVLAVVIGGTAFTGGRFSLAGSVIGALIMQTLTTGILMRGIGVEYTLVVKAIAVILICTMQSPSFRELFRRPRKSRALSK
jgi:simple sugar transport system permease protein